MIERFDSWQDTNNERGRRFVCSEDEGHTLD